VGSVGVFELLHGHEYGYRLQGLAETHFVGEDAIHAVLLETEHPVQTLELVGSVGRRRGGEVVS
jgi:hypothetical protein